MGLIWKQEHNSPDGRYTLALFWNWLQGEGQEKLAVRLGVMQEAPGRL